MKYVNTGEQMDIYAPEGSKVMYTGKGGLDGDVVFANKHLTVGTIYTVFYTDIGSWQTAVALKEIPTHTFNSACFEEVVEKEAIEKYSIFEELKEESLLEKSEEYASNRERIALLAMQGLLNSGSNYEPKILAELSVNYADALLEALAKN